MSTLGFTGIGAQTSVSGAQLGSKFVTSEVGTISKMSVYVPDVGLGTDSVRVAIYSDVAGTPTTKLAESSGAVALTATGWTDVTISYGFSAGVTLWLMYFKSGTEGSVSYDTPGDVTDQMAYYLGGTYPTWSDPFGFSGVLDRKASIYATYTSGAPSTGYAVFPRWGSVRR